MTKDTNHFEVSMTLEHVGQSVQQYLRAYGYFQGDNDHFELKNIKFNRDGTVRLEGEIANGP